MLIFVLSHITHTKPVSANLRIMTVHPFFPSQCSSNTVWVTSAAFPLTKIIAQRENKSFQIVSWHKHFGSFLYYHWKGKNLRFQTFCALVMRKMAGLSFLHRALLFLPFIALAVATFKEKKPVFLVCCYYTRACGLKTPWVPIDTIDHNSSFGVTSGYNIQPYQWSTEIGR